MVKDDDGENETTGDVRTDLSAFAAARSPKHKDHLQLGLLS